VVVKGGYEAVVHGICVALNIHHDRVVFQVNIVNTFNSILHEAIFQELWAASVTDANVMEFIHLNVHPCI
jgi:hypothetical protein